MANKDVSDSAAGLVKSPKNGISNWIEFGVPVAILIIVGAVLGSVLGSRAANKNNNNGGSGGSSSGASSGGNAPADPSAAASTEQAIGIYATATNSYYMIPLYPSTVSPLFALWNIALTGHRPILQLSLSPPSLIPQTQNSLGQKIPLRQLTLVPRLFALTNLASLRLHTSGTPFPCLFKMTCISNNGTTPSLEMPWHITTSRLWYIIWMMLVVFSTMPKKSRRESRPSCMLTA